MVPCLLFELKGSRHTGVMYLTDSCWRRGLLHDVRAGAQPAIAEAGQEQPDSATLQPQGLGHAQAAPLACWLGAAASWQPQAQSLPGQLAHWQGEA